MGTGASESAAFRQGTVVLVGAPRQSPVPRRSGHAQTRLPFPDFAVRTNELHPRLRRMRHHQTQRLDYSPFSQAPLNIGPRHHFRLSAVDIGDAATDLGSPGGFNFGVWFVGKAAPEQRSEIRSVGGWQCQRLLEEPLGCSIHDVSLSHHAAVCPVATAFFTNEGERLGAEAVNTKWGKRGIPEPMDIARTGGGQAVGARSTGCLSVRALPLLALASSLTHRPRRRQLRAGEGRHHLGGEDPELLLELGGRHALGPVDQHLIEARIPLLVRL